VTDAELKEILSNSKKRKHVVLFSLLAATGLRVGEALALRSTDFGPDCRVLHVRRSVWRGPEQEPKTSNAVRVVDIPEVLARELRDYVSTTNGLLFATADGRPLQQRNVLRILHGRKQVGFHAFRRFRLTWLRKNSVPKDLERYWMGHAPEEVVPLVTADMGLRCSLDILLLRPEEDRFIFNAGDIDGQIKTLFDALRMPKDLKETGEVGPQQDETPFFCLLEDDKLIFPWEL
jgi:integrase